MEHHSHTLLNSPYCTRVSEHTLTQLRPGFSLPSVSWSPANVLLSVLGGPIPVVLATPSVHRAKILQNTPLYLSIWQSEVKWLDHDCEWPSYPVVPCAVHLWTAIVQLEKTSNIVPSRTGDVMVAFWSLTVKSMLKTAKLSFRKSWVNSSKANQIMVTLKPALITIHSVANILTHFCPGLFMVSRFLVIHFICIILYTSNQ